MPTGERWLSFALRVPLGLREVYDQVPQSGFLLFLAICAAIYLAVRGWIWARNHLLWRLRNRLIAAYVFIAVVPVLLLLTMAGLAAYLLYWQLGSYVIYSEMEERVERLGAVNSAMATSYAVEAISGKRAAALTLPEDATTFLKNAMTELPGLRIETGKGDDLLARWRVGPHPFPRTRIQRRPVLVSGPSSTTRPCPGAFWFPRRFR